MKKLAIVLCIIAITGLLAACTGKGSEGATGRLTKDNIKVGFIYSSSIHDEGFSQAHDKGRLALEAMGIPCLYYESVPANADAETAIRNLIDQGCNVIYANSFGFMDWTLKVAEEFPDLYFGHCSGFKRAENMSSYFGKIYQPRYLSGIAAGYKTQVNKIGYVAAHPIPEVIRGINAFTLGVRSVNPEATVEVLWTSTWFNPALEKQGAIDLITRGVDVIAQHQNTTSPQIAAEEREIHAVGYNLPGLHAAPNAYLTAPLFHWEKFYVDDVQRIIDGTWESRAFWGGLETGVVSLDTLTDNNDPRAAAMIDSVREQIISGEFEPFTGPLRDQTGTVRVPEGVKMTDDEIWGMNWFVQGVIATLPN